MSKISRMIQFVASVKLTLTLLATIGLLSIWGTLAPTLNIYYHPIYLAALSLLAVNVFACTLRRLLTSGVRLTSRSFGYVFSHFGILVILLGSLVSLAFGVRTLVWLGPGESVDQISTPRGSLEDMGFQLSLKQFRMNYYPSGMLKDFISEITVKEPDQTIQASSITVNHPLSVGRYSVFQSSYRLRNSQTIRLRITHADDSEQSIEIRVPGEPVVITTDSCEPLTVKGLQYEPDFIMMGPGQFGSRSINPNNPAVLLSLKCGNGETENKWFFRNQSNFHFSNRWKDIAIQFISADHEFDSGLEFVRDPGTNWVATGAAMLIVGLFFYLLPVSRKGDQSA